MQIESEFILIYGSEPDYDIPGYIHIFSLGLEDKPLVCLRILGRISEVDAFISDKQYALITAHLQPSHFLASLTKVRKKTLYVMHVTQHLADPSHSRLYRAGLRRFLRGKRIVTVSRGLQEELQREYGIAPESVCTIYNPCSAAFRKEGSQERPHEKPYILVMGRLEEQKDPLRALDLYAEGGFPDRYDLVYLGKGSLEAKLKERIAEQHLQEHVFLAGFQKDPVCWLANAALLLSCSRLEGFSMNLAEALICGTPAVACDCPHGPKEIMTGELARYLIKPGAGSRESIMIISSALEAYPEITETYYDQFDSGLILRTYLEVWKHSFAAE